MKDQLRPGQRIVDYAYLKKCIPESKPGQISPLENWLWNLSEEEFKKVMNWSPNDD
jgi:hypothetical protein